MYRLIPPLKTFETGTWPEFFFTISLTLSGSDAGGAWKSSNSHGTAVQLHEVIAFVLSRSRLIQLKIL